MKFSFHFRRSPTVVNRPPLPYTFSNGMSVWKPSRPSEYATARFLTMRVKSSRQEVCVIPSGANSRARVNSGNGVPLTRETIIAARLKPVLL